MAAGACSNCGTAIIARGPEPPAGRYCMAHDCQRARYRAQNRLRGAPPPVRPCSWCGAAIPPDRRRHGTCSPTCAREQRHLTQRGYYQRLIASEPNHNTGRHAHRRARASADPDYAAHLREIQAAAQERRRERFATDPGYREHILARARAIYHRHAATVQERRRERLDAMTPELRAAWLAQQRTYQRAYAARRRADRTPEEHAAYIAELVEYRRQRALAGLAADARRLTERMNTDGTD